APPCISSLRSCLLAQLSSHGALPDTESRQSSGIPSRRNLPCLRVLRGSHFSLAAAPHSGNTASHPLQVRRGQSTKMCEVLLRRGRPSKSNRPCTLPTTNPARHLIPQGPESRPASDGERPGGKVRGSVLRSQRRSGS